MAGDRPPNPREAVCRHRPRRPPICAAGKYRLDGSSAEWRRQLVDRTATLPAETKSRQPLRACLLAGREQRGFIRPATAQVRKRGRGSGRVSACQYDAVLRAPAQPDRGTGPRQGDLAGVLPEPTLVPLLVLLPNPNRISSTAKIPALAPATNPTTITPILPQQRRSAGCFSYPSSSQPPQDLLPDAFGHVLTCQFSQFFVGRLAGQLDRFPSKAH